MVKYDRFDVVVAVVTFVLCLLLPFDLAYHKEFVSLVDDSPLRWLIGLWAVLGMPLAFAMPLLRANFMGRYWKVPSTAYIFPRRVLRFICGALAGQMLATLILAASRDQRLFWLSLLQLLIGGAFCLGTWQRLRKPAKSEFTVPWFPRLR